MKRLIAQTIAMSVTMLTVLTTVAVPHVSARTHNKTATVQKTKQKPHYPYTAITPKNIESPMFQTAKNVSVNQGLAANKKKLKVLQQHTTMDFTTRPTPPPPAPPKIVFASAYASVTKQSHVKASDLNRVLGGSLRGHGASFVRYGKEYGIDPAFLASISMQETGNGTSYAVRVEHNVGGMMGQNGLLRFRSIDESIASLAQLIRTKYVDDGLVTPKEIQRRYAPLGVHNDPSNLNRYWLSNVVSNWRHAQSA